MCAACVGQGVVYAGGAIGALRVMAYRARRRRTSHSGLAWDDGRPSDELTAPLSRDAHP